MLGDIEVAELHNMLTVLRSCKGPDECDIMNFRTMEHPLSEDESNNLLSANESDNPLSENESNNLLSENESNNPLPANESNNPLSENESNNPLSENESNNPLSANESNNPLSANESNNPLSENESNNPLSAIESNNSVDTSGLTEAQMTRFDSSVLPFVSQDTLPLEASRDDLGSKSNFVNSLQGLGTGYTLRRNENIFDLGEMKELSNEVTTGQEQYGRNLPRKFHGLQEGRRGPKGKRSKKEQKRRRRIIRRLRKEYNRRRRLDNNCECARCNKTQK